MATPVKLQETSVITENRQCRDPAVSRKCLCRVNEKEKARKPFFRRNGKKTHRRRLYPGRQFPSAVWYSFSNIFPLDVTGDSLPFYFIASRMFSEHT